MFVHVTAQGELRVGSAIAVQGESPSRSFAAVFEDDGQTGYFYALDLAAAPQPIVDAVHIYNAEAVTDRERPSTVKVAWSANGTSVVLLINDYPHAVFDFQLQRGYCRSGFPPTGASASWSGQGHSWSESALGLFSSGEP